MAKNKKSIPLDASDIKKYLAGNAVNAHETEKKLLSDALASDALDGYIAMHDDKVNENAIKIDLKNRLQDRISKKKNSNLLVWRNISIAASLVAVLGASYFYFDHFTDLNKLQAIQLPAQKIETNEVSTTLDSKNTESRPILKQKENQNKAKIIETPDLAKAKLKTSDIVFEDKEIASPEKSEDKILASAPIVSSEVLPKPAAMEAPSEQLSGNIMDAEKQPIIGAIVKSKNGKNIAQTDEKGNFKIEKDKNTEGFEISAIGYKTEEVSYANVQKANIVLKEDNSVLSEVTVSKQKAKSVPAPESKSLQIEEPKPKMGWGNFDDMLRHSIKQTGSVTTLTFEDPITVKVMVESNGKVSKVEVQSPKMSKEDSEAIAKTIESKTRWFPARKSGKKIRKQVSRKVNAEETKK